MKNEEEDKGDRCIQISRGKTYRECARKEVHGSGRRIGRREGGREKGRHRETEGGNGIALEMFQLAEK